MIAPQEKEDYDEKYFVLRLFEIIWNYNDIILLQITSKWWLRVNPTLLLSLFHLLERWRWIFSNS